MTLGTRISIVTASTILIVVAIIIINARMSIAEVEERFRDEAITGNTVLWSKIISSQTDHMLSNARSLNAEPDVLAALKKKNWADLSVNAMAAYKQLLTTDVLNRMQLADMNGEIIFSAPNKFSGATQKHTVKSVLEGDKLNYGVELDDDNVLVVSVAFPLYSQGVQIGVGVYMRSLQTALEDFRKSDNSELFVVNAEGSEIYTTKADMFSRLQLDLPELGKHSVSMGQLNDRQYTVVAQPVIDTKGGAIAYLVSARDRTENYEGEWWIVAATYSFNGVLLICAVLGLFWYLKKLTEPLVKISTAMEEIADGDGDLTQRMQATGTEELVKLATAFNKFVDKIENVVSDARINLDSISALAKQTADGNADLARRTEAEVTNLIKASASMKAMTNSVKQTADLSEGATDISDKAKLSAQDAALALTMVIGSVEMIDTGSEKMDSIIQVINEIAFQTNLLALNASIEAAHAGDKGKGFAVVAGEVRVLAQRSASAAREISTLIRSNIENAKEGSALVEQAAEALGEMSGSIQKVAAAISEISRTCRDQANGIDQVNRVVLEIEEMTQKNTTMVEQIAIASDSVDRQSNELNDMMHYFKIGKTGGGSCSNLVVSD